MGLDETAGLIDQRITEDAVRRVRLRVPQAEGKVLSELEAESADSLPHLSRRIC